MLVGQNDTRLRAFWIAGWLCYPSAICIELTIIVKIRQQCDFVYPIIYIVRRVVCTLVFVRDWIALLKFN